MVVDRGGLRYRIETEGNFKSLDRFLARLDRADRRIREIQDRLAKGFALGGGLDRLEKAQTEQVKREQAARRAANAERRANERLAASEQRANSLAEIKRQKETQRLRQAHLLTQKEQANLAKSQEQAEAARDARRQKAQAENRKALLDAQRAEKAALDTEKKRLGVVRERLRLLRDIFNLQRQQQNQSEKLSRAAERRARAAEREARALARAADNARALAARRAGILSTKRSVEEGNVQAGIGALGERRRFLELRRIHQRLLRLEARRVALNRRIEFSAGATQARLRGQTSEIARQIALLRLRQRELRGAPGQFSNRNLVQTLQGTLLRVTTAFLFFETFRRGIEGIRSIVSVGVAFNSEILKAEQALTGVVAQSSRLRDIQGQLLEDAEAFAAAQGVAEEQLDKLRIDALNTVATFQELASAFQVSFAFGVGAGFDADQIREFAVDISQAATIFGVAQNALAEEIRSILRGTIRARDTRIATALGITNEQIRNARQAGELFEFLQGKFEQLSTATENIANSLPGLFQRVRDAAQQVLGGAAAPLVGELEEGLRTVLGLLRTDEGQLNPDAIGAFQPIFEALASVLSGITDTIREDGLSGLSETLEKVAGLIPKIAEFLTETLPLGISLVIGLTEGAIAVFSDLSSAVSVLGGDLETLGKVLGFLGAGFLVSRLLSSFAPLLLGVGRAALFAAAGIGKLVTLLRLLRLSSLIGGSGLLAGLFSATGLGIAGLLGGAAIALADVAGGFDGVADSADRAGRAISDLTEEELFQEFNRARARPVSVFESDAQGRQRERRLEALAQAAAEATLARNAAESITIAFERLRVAVTQSSTAQEIQAVSEALQALGLEQDKLARQARLIELGVDPQDARGLEDTLRIVEQLRDRSAELREEADRIAIPLSEGLESLPAGIRDILSSFGDGATELERMGAAIAAITELGGGEDRGLSQIRELFDLSNLEEARTLLHGLTNIAEEAGVAFSELDRNFGTTSRVADLLGVGPIEVFPLLQRLNQLIEEEGVALSDLVQQQGSLAEIADLFGVGAEEANALLQASAEIADDLNRFNGLRSEALELEREAQSLAQASAARQAQELALQERSTALARARAQFDRVRTRQTARLSLAAVGGAEAEGVADLTTAQVAAVSAEFKKRQTILEDLERIDSSITSLEAEQARLEEGRADGLAPEDERLLSTLQTQLETLRLSKLEREQALALTRETAEIEREAALLRQTQEVEGLRRENEDLASSILQQRNLLIAGTSRQLQSLAGVVNQTIQLTRAATSETEQLDQRIEALRRTSSELQSRVLNRSSVPASDRTGEEQALLDADRESAELAAIELSRLVDQRALRQELFDLERGRLDVELRRAAILAGEGSAAEATLVGLQLLQESLPTFNEAIAQSVQDIAQSSVTAISGAVKALFTDDVSGALDQVALQFANSVLDSLINNLVNSLAGSFLSSILPASSQAATALELGGIAAGQAIIASAQTAAGILGGGSLFSQQGSAAFLSSPAYGGLIGVQGKASGGRISADRRRLERRIPGMDPRDRVLAALRVGEFVIPPEQVRNYGLSAMEGLRRGTINPQDLAAISVPQSRIGLPDTTDDLSGFASGGIAGDKGLPDNTFTIPGLAPDSRSSGPIAAYFTQEELERALTGRDDIFNELSRRSRGSVRPSLGT